MDTKAIRGHRDLAAWQESMALAKTIYEITSGFPADERFGLVSQMRRCAVSIPSNLAEGAGRGGKKEFSHFLSIARGSLSELETQITLAAELGFMEADENLTALISRLFKLLHGLQRKLQA